MLEFGGVDEDEVVGTSTTTSTCCDRHSSICKSWLTRCLGEMWMMWVVSSLDQWQDVVQQRPRDM